MDQTSPLLKNMRGQLGRLAEPSQEINKKPLSRQILTTSKQTTVQSQANDYFALLSNAGKFRNLSPEIR